jgi:hypothetical protein
MIDLDKIFQSELHFKIVTFFYQNPSSVDTAKGIAPWVNHEPKEVKEALEELVGFGILVAHRSDLVTGFAYTQDKEISKLIANYFKNKTNNQTG